jgi:hypothetical protein
MFCVKRLKNFFISKIFSLITAKGHMLFLYAQQLLRSHLEKVLDLLGVRQKGPTIVRKIQQLSENSDFAEKVHPLLQKNPFWGRIFKPKNPPYRGCRPVSTESRREDNMFRFFIIKTAVFIRKSPVIDFLN